LHIADLSDIHLVPHTSATWLVARAHAKKDGDLARLDVIVLGLLQRWMAQELPDPGPKGIVFGLHRGIAVGRELQ
jgi:hypothetical protein